MKLLIDLGNTNLKWCLAGPQGLLDVQCYPHQGDAAAISFAFEQAELDFNHITSASLCSVASVELVQAVNHYLSSRVSVELISVSPQACGVSCAYDDVSRLGVDRWAGLIAAHNLFPQQAVLVVDIGTAVTLDGLLATGEHLGGQIIPGLEMMQLSLGRGTAQVGFVSTDKHAPAWFGRTTEQGVDSGTRYAIASLIEAAYKVLLSDYDSNAVLLLTGGGMEMIKPIIKVTMRSEPELVFQGLSLIAGD